jgi:hypothetical protein
MRFAFHKLSDWQTIAVIWTLLSRAIRFYIHTVDSHFLEQNPYGGTGPVIGKAMVVCPVSLIEVCRHCHIIHNAENVRQNWRKEFHKW